MLWDRADISHMECKSSPESGSNNVRHTYLYAKKFAMEGPGGLLKGPYEIFVPVGIPVD